MIETGKRDENMRFKRTLIEISTGEQEDERPSLDRAIRPDKESEHTRRPSGPADASPISSALSMVRSSAIRILESG